MAGNTDGGRKAAVQNKLRHGKDFYARIGAMGGKKGTTGGFAANRELARLAGAKGGRISRRRKTQTTQVEDVATQIADSSSTIQTTQTDLDLAA
jgi:general stress protein YciG